MCIMGKMVNLLVTVTQYEQVLRVLVITLNMLSYIHCVCVLQEGGGC